jgi:hypothetical protein
MITDIPAVMTVITLLEGMAYAPWVKVILLFGMVPVALAYCWRAVARYVMHPDSRALASMLLMGFTQIDRRLKHGLPLCSGDGAPAPAMGSVHPPGGCGSRKPITVEHAGALST